MEDEKNSAVGTITPQISAHLDPPNLGTKTKDTGKRNVLIISGVVLLVVLAIVGVGMLTKANQTKNLQGFLKKMDQQTQELKEGQQVEVENSPEVIPY